jgi:mevalonate pyrophosphate decarboxylase
MEAEPKAVSSVTAEAYPTIPIIFVSSARDNRLPVHNSMGLSVTDKNGQTKVVTKIIRTETGRLGSFRVNGEELPQERRKSIEDVLRTFQEATGKHYGFDAESNNYNVFSGSSDAGAAALVVALDRMFGTDYSNERIAILSNSISESAVRAVYGGLNILVVDGPGAPYGRQLASDDDLKDIKIFAMGFDYPSRISAAEIFQLTRSNPFYDYRLKMMPQWEAKIKLGIINRDWKLVFSSAEENCANAHYLIESSGKRVRKREMMDAIINIEEIRESGMPVYWTAGGGKVINAFTWEPYGDAVFKALKERGQEPIEYKVAPAAMVTSVEYSALKTTGD